MKWKVMRTDNDAIEICFEESLKVYTIYNTTIAVTMSLEQALELAEQLVYQAERESVLTSEDIEKRVEAARQLKGIWKL